MDSPDQTKKGLPIGVDHGIDIIGDEWDEGCSDNTCNKTDTKKTEFEEVN